MVDDGPRDGWKTVQMDDVQVGVPDDWDRVDMTGCPLVYERWAAQSSSAACDSDQGLALLDSSTFDPRDGPGVRRYGQNGSPAWGGYVLVGGLAVNVFDDDRELVRAVLDSAEQVTP